jgi:hypothetical protein
MIYASEIGTVAITADVEPNGVSNAIGYAMHNSRSRNAVIRVYDDAGNVVETHEHKGDFKEP